MGAYQDVSNHNFYLILGIFKGLFTMKRLLFLIFTSLFLVPISLFAQVTVHGTVVDQETHDPISDVTVMIKGTNINTETNEHGKFSISSNQNITKLVITCIGYKSKEVTVTNSGHALFIQLLPAQIELPGVQVVGSRQIKQAQSIGILSTSELKSLSGLRLSTTINTIPGVFMQSRTPWGGARITIRGYYPSTSGNTPNFNGLGYQVYLNNIPITDATGTTILDGIDFSSLGNVKVIKGPSSSLYGSFIGGAVLMHTTQPTPNQTSLQEQASAGNYGLFRSSTTFMSAGKNSDITLEYGNQKYNSFRPHSASRKDFIRLNGDFRIDSKQVLSTYFSYSRSLEQLAGEIDASDFYARKPVSNALYLANNSHTLMRNYLLGVTDNYQIRDHLMNKTTIFGSGYTLGQPFAHGFSDATQFNFGGRTTFDYSTYIENVGVNGTLGAMFQRSNIADNGVFIVPAPPHPQFPHTQENFAMNYSVFTQWKFSLPQEVTVTVGASLNKDNFGIRNLLQNKQINDTTNLKTRSFNPVFTPNISISKLIGKNISIYANVGAGYTPPLLSSVIASDGSVDLSLKPERAVQYEIGTKGTWIHNRLVYHLTLFDLENTHKLIQQTSNSITFTTNAGKQRNRGLEASLSYRIIGNRDQFISSLRPWISYTYSDFKYADFKSNNDNNASTVNYSGNYVARVPKNTLNAGVNIDSNVGLYLNGTYRYVGKAPVTFDNSTYVKAYNLLNMKLGYKTQLGKHFSLNIFAGGNNLLSSTYYRFLFVGPNINSLAQPKDGGTGDGYIIPGPYKPSFYGNITLRYIL